MARPQEAETSSASTSPAGGRAPLPVGRRALEAWQLDRLRQLLHQVIPRNPFWTARLGEASVLPDALRTLDDLRCLPLTTKAEFVADQAAHPPYGTNLTFPLTAYTRLHQTSGTTTGQPLRWLDTPDSWRWLLGCWQTLYEMMGLRSDDRLCFLFSFGPFLGFWAGFEGAVQAGRLCLAAGGLSSEARLRCLIDNQITLVGCTPTYALRLAEVAREQGIDLTSSAVRTILVAGEPGGNIAATRQAIEAAWGARVVDHWGMTEVGPLAIECPETSGSLTVLETECIAEIIDPAGTDPVPPGHIGELVITNLGRVGSPAIRLRTGDLVRAATAPDPTGRDWLRLEGGILGRTDDMLIIRGNNVFPSSIEAVVRTFPEVAEFRIVVTQRRAMPHLRLEIEPVPGVPAVAPAEPSAPIPLERRVSQAVQQRLNFQIETVVVPPGSLPRFEMKARRVFREA
jgi:phenylacetate-CoA ligase